MIKYPLYFHAEVKSGSGKDTPFEGRVEEYPPVVCAIPKGFGGKGGGYSPEELYIMAISACLIATFKVFAEKAQLAFEDIHADAKLTIDRNEQGVPELQKVDVVVTLKGAKDQEKAKTLLGEAEKFCLVTNAVKSAKTFTYKFT